MIASRSYRTSYSGGLVQTLKLLILSILEELLLALNLSKLLRSLGHLDKIPWPQATGSPRLYCGIGSLLTDLLLSLSCMLWLTPRFCPLQTEDGVLVCDIQMVGMSLTHSPLLEEVSLPSPTCLGKYF